MNPINMTTVATRTILGIAILTLTNVAQAFDMGDMMKPGKWFGNDDDHHYRYSRGYWRGPYGYGGGPYGYGGYPGYGPYGQPRTIIISPSNGGERAAPSPLPPE